MSEEPGTTINQASNGENASYVEFAQKTMDTFLSKADVKAVYGAPIQKDDSVIIPAAEILATAGFGGGEAKDADEKGGGGSGTGGGGRVFSRPVAVIIATPNGVRVEPVLDVTKIGLAALTAAGFMLATLMRMRYPGRR